MVDHQIHQFWIGNGIKVDYMVDHKSNRMKTIHTERHHMGKSLKYNPINPKTVNRKLFLLPALAAAIVFFSFGAAGSGSGSLPKSDIASVYAQADSSNNNSTNKQATNLDQLASNLTQAREAISAGNSTEATAQLTSVIGELSDTIARITSDQNGQYQDEHTHVFTHKDHTHTVTHKHPHNSNDHHQDWTDRHHIFNPSHCPPGRMC